MVWRGALLALAAAVSVATGAGGAAAVSGSGGGARLLYIGYCRPFPFPLSAHQSPDVDQSANYKGAEVFKVKAIKTGIFKIGCKLLGQSCHPNELCCPV